MRDAATQVTEYAVLTIAISHSFTILCLNFKYFFGSFLDEKLRVLFLEP